MVVSFLGAQAIDREGFDAIAALALAGFIGSVLCSVYVLVPKPSLIFALRGPVLFEQEYSGDADVGETHRRLSYWIEGFREANQRTIDDLFRWYRFATVALAAEVVLWTAHLAAIVPL